MCACMCVCMNVYVGMCVDMYICIHVRSMILSRPRICWTMYVMVLLMVSMSSSFYLVSNWFLNYS